MPNTADTPQVLNNTTAYYFEITFKRAKHFVYFKNYTNVQSIRLNDYQI